LRWHKTEKNGPHICKLSAFLGAAHGMLLVPHGNEKKKIKRQLRFAAYLSEDIQTSKKGWKQWGFAIYHL
jgi:hypothetical protein